MPASGGEEYQSFLFGTVIRVLWILLNPGAKSVLGIEGRELLGIGFF